MASRKAVLASWDEYQSVLNAMVSSVSSLPGCRDVGAVGDVPGKSPSCGWHAR